MTLTVRPAAAFTTPSISRCTSAQSPALAAPTWMTISSSSAPMAAQLAASAAFCSGVMAPSGNPTTQHTFTPVPCSSFAASGIYTGLTQTLAKWYAAASAHSFSICSGVASGFSSVWSIMAAMVFLSMANRTSDFMV